MLNAFLDAFRGTTGLLLTSWGVNFASFQLLVLKSEHHFSTGEREREKWMIQYSKMQAVREVMIFLGNWNNILVTKN